MKEKKQIVDISTSQRQNHCQTSKLSICLIVFLRNTTQKHFVFGIVSEKP